MINNDTILYCSALFYILCHAEETFSSSKSENNNYIQNKANVSGIIYMTLQKILSLVLNY